MLKEDLLCNNLIWLKPDLLKKTQLPSISSLGYVISEDWNMQPHLRELSLPELLEFQSKFFDFGIILTWWVLGQVIFQALRLCTKLHLIWSKVTAEGWWCSSLVDCMLSMLEALGWILSIKHKLQRLIEHFSGLFWYYNMNGSYQLTFGFREQEESWQFLNRK